jgi:hypothetical protein
VKGLAAAGALLLVACGNQPSGDAVKILRQSGAAMALVQTASATLKVTKGTLSVQNFALTSAATSVRMPADSDTTYKVKEQDITFAIQVVVTAGHVYVHVPLSRGFVEDRSGQFPNMARLFDPTTGLPALIPSGANKRWIASEQLDGRTVDHVSTTYTPEQVRGLLAQLNSSGPVTANLWVGSDHLIRKAVLDGDFGDGGKEAAVEVDIASYNATVSITSPTP